MAQENIIVKLPKSKSENATAVIRGFVKNKDRKAIRRASLIGTEIDPKDIGEDDKVNIKLKAENMGGVVDEQVKRLLISYEGNTEDPYEALLESEYEEDMTAVEEAVQKVFNAGGDAKATAKK
jgi:hypothetical protein